MEQIIIHLAPIDVSSFAKSSNATRSLVYNSTDQHLWRSLFLLQAFDDPRICVDLLGCPSFPKSRNEVGEDEYDWKGELQRRTRAATVMQNPDVCKPDEAIQVLKTLLDMASNIPITISPVYIPDSELSLNLAWIKSQDPEARFLTSLRSRGHISEEENQLRARLHVYYGMIVEDLDEGGIVRARSYVYDMRNYTRDSYYGPFIRDGSAKVNWVHLEAIQMVMGSHLVSYDESTGQRAYSQSRMNLPYCQSFVRPLPREDGNGRKPVLVGETKEDWAGVQGRWKCAFCFCDHRDLIGTYYLFISC